MLEKDSKLFYPIGEVARMFDVNISLIRFWEKEFDIIKPKKNKRGVRMFTKDDVKNFRIIYHLVKECGMTLKGAQMKLQENPEQVQLHADVVGRLKNIRQSLQNIYDTLG